MGAFDVEAFDADAFDADESIQIEPPRRSRSLKSATYKRRARSKDEDELLLIL